MIPFSALHKLCDFAFSSSLTWHKIIFKLLVLGHGIQVPKDKTTYKHSTYRINGLIVWLLETYAPFCISVTASNGLLSQLAFYALIVCLVGATELNYDHFWSSACAPNGIRMNSELLVFFSLSLMVVYLIIDLFTMLCAYFN